MTVDSTPMTYNPTVVRFAEKKRRNSDDARVQKFRGQQFGQSKVDVDDEDDESAGGGRHRA
jgi:hypothetical protein